MCARGGGGEAPLERIHERFGAESDVELRRLNALDASFFEQEDARTIARELVGKHLYTHVAGERVGGRILETEAYCARGDAALAMHIARRPRASAVLLGPAGRAYLYVVQGGNVLFNITCAPAGVPGAVLVRAAEPVVGEEIMRARGAMPRSPGLLSRAFGLAVSMSGDPLGGLICIDDAGETPAVRAEPRIGLAYAGNRAATARWRYVFRR